MPVVPLVLRAQSDSSRWWISYQIEHEIVGPQAATFADGGWLGGLEMGEAEAGQGTMLGGKPSHRIDRRGETPCDQLEGVSNENDVGVVGDEAAGCAEVDDRFRLGALFGVGFNVCHDVVPTHALFFFCDVEVEVLFKPPHLVELRIRDRQAKLLFSLRQGDPQPAPGLKTSIRPPKFRHLPRRIPLDQRILVRAGGRSGCVGHCVGGLAAFRGWRKCDNIAS